MNPPNRDPSWRALICTVVVFLGVVLIVSALSVFLLVITHHPVILAILAGFVIIRYVVSVLRDSFREIPPGRRLAVFFLGSFEACYCTESDYNELSERYLNGTDDNPVTNETRKWFHQICRRSYLLHFGLGDLVYAPWPFYRVEEVITDLVRIPITEVDRVLTLGEPGAESLELLVDGEVTLRLGLDIGLFKNAFSDVKLGTQESVIAGLKTKLEPELHGAMRDAGKEFTWNGSRHIRDYMDDYENRVRELCRQKSESPFVQGGFMQSLSESATDNGGPGAVAFNIAFEAVGPKDPKARESINAKVVARYDADAAAHKTRVQAAADADATQLREDALTGALERRAKVLNVDSSVAIAHDAIKNTKGVVVLGDKDMIGAMKNAVSVPKNPPSP